MALYRLAHPMLLSMLLDGLADPSGGRGRCGGSRGTNGLDQQAEHEKDEKRKEKAADNRRHGQLLSAEVFLATTLTSCRSDRISPTAAPVSVNRRSLATVPVQ
jgi:hypothetical protein